MSPLLKELKNTVYEAAISRKVIDASFHFDYSLEKRGKGIRLSARDENGERLALSFLSRVDSKEILHFADEINVRFPVRAIEVTREVSDARAHQEKAIELGYSHLILNQAKRHPYIKTGLRVSGLTEEGFHVPGEHDFYVYTSEASRPDDDFILSDLFKRELERLEKSDKAVWFELPSSVTPAIIKALDIRMKKGRLILKPEFPVALKKEGRIGSSLLVSHEMRYPLWPVLEAPQMAGLKGHNYAGLYVKVDRLPKDLGVLDRNLWAIAQAAIRGGAVEEYIQGEGPIEEATRLADRFKRGLNPSKTLFTQILCEIQMLEEQTSSPQFRAFFRDARRLLHKKLQDNQINIPYVLREEDFAPSFYTHAVSQGGSSIRTQAEVVIKKSIDSEGLDSTLREIYESNTIP